MNKGISQVRVKQSLKALALHHLINEQFESTATFADVLEHLKDFHYSKNELGQQFLNFII